VILAARLRNQWLARPAAARPADVVQRLVAMQAQDFIGARWALGLRAAGLDDAAVQAAFDRGEILRTHVMRPTWHFVTPADIGWLLTLTAPRVHQASAFYYRQLGLDAKTMSRVHRVLSSGSRAVASAPAPSSRQRWPRPGSKPADRGSGC
jgi:hypothetical protein